MPPKKAATKKAATKKKQGTRASGRIQDQIEREQGRIQAQRERDRYPHKPKPVFDNYIELIDQKAIHAQVMEEALRKCAELQKPNYNDFEKHSQSFHERDYTVNPYTRKGKGSIVKNNAASFTKNWATIGTKKYLQNQRRTRGQYGKPGAHIDMDWYDENMTGVALAATPGEIGQLKWLLKNATYAKRLALGAGIDSDINRYGILQNQYSGSLAKLKDTEKRERASATKSKAKSNAKSKAKSNAKSKAKRNPRKKAAEAAEADDGFDVAVPSGTGPSDRNRALAAIAKRKRQTLAASAITDPLEPPLRDAVGKRPIRPAGNTRRKRQKK